MRRKYDFSAPRGHRLTAGRTSMSRFWDWFSTPWPRASTSQRVLIVALTLVNIVVWYHL